MRRRWSVWGLAMLIAGAGAAVPARGEIELWSRGSLAVGGYHDDNLFSTPAPAESDTIRRLTPAVEAGLRTGRWSLAARYAQDAESFADHPGLDTLRARQSGGIELSGRPTRTLGVELLGTYTRTLAPGELNLGTGLLAGRAAATRVTLDPTLVFRPGHRNAGRAGLSLARDDLAGGIGSRTGRAFLGWERRASERSAAGVEYAFTRYDFDTEEPRTAHTVSFGWDGSLGRRTTLEVRGGPRFSEGEVDPEGGVTLRHDRRRIDLSLAWSRSLATVIGRAGTVTGEGLTAAVAFRPAPRWRFSLAPQRYRTRDASGGGEATVTLLAFDAAWRAGRWLDLELSWQRIHQDGAPGIPPPAGGTGAPEIERNLLMLRVVARPGSAPGTAPPRGAGGG